MRYLFLLPLLIVVSCATTPQYSHLDRVSICKTKAINSIHNRHKYWGNCYINITESDKNFNKMINKSVGINTWNYLKAESNNILARVEEGEITPSIGNRQFERYLNELSSIEDKIRAEQVARNQRIGMALGAVSQSINQASQINTTGYQPIKMKYYLEDNYMSGGNRICIYSNGGAKATHTISGIGLCPTSMDF